MNLTMLPLRSSLPMNRRRLLKGALTIAVLPLLGACSRDSSAGAPTVTAIDRPTSFWRDKVDSEAFAVLFEDRTEPAFSSPLNKEHRPGVFICAACYLPLFESDSKYDSGTGWPSFTRPIEGQLGTRTDFKLILPRTEYHCARCGGHQGHVFDDGPPPLGKRWCNNGVALRFVAQGQSLPELRG